MLLSEADVADQLGAQAREALAIFVREIDRIDASTQGALLRSYDDGDVFEAAASLLMRLVFLLKAEESGLLPHGAAAYDGSYGGLYLLACLEREHRLAPDRLLQSTEAYARLLGTFRLIHDGSQDPDIKVVAYGGDLFDADKHPLLEGRDRDGSPIGRMAPPPVRDVVVRAMLRRLKMLEIEQLGHIYESLLHLRLQRAPVDSSLRLLAPADQAAIPSASVAEIDGRPPAAGVVRPGGLYVDFGHRRHDQGAVYTPTSITEPMVRKTLEPLVYVQDGGTRRLRSARVILNLRVCDPAMGAAAFLVQAVRFLAERLVDSWDEASATEPGVTLTMPYGSHAEGEPGELLMPESREERVVWARRFVAERCVYGVDVNPLAVEMAKLSLWLTTAAPDKPFTFLDHALRCGNSIIGADLEQVRSWSLDRTGVDQPLLKRLLENTRDEPMSMRHALSTAADLLVASWLASGDDGEREARSSSALSRVVSARTNADWEALEASARAALGATVPFHWPAQFPDVFLEARGFDAVIGNPPYVRQEIFSPLKPLLKRSFAAFDGNADLYVYFCELGLRLLRPGGRLALIVTNKWMKATYGARLRELLAGSAWLESVVDFGHAKQMFKGVDVFPCILSATKPSPGGSAPNAVRVCVIDRAQLCIDDLGHQIDEEGFDYPRDALGPRGWQLDPPSVRRLLEKMRSVSVPLKDAVGIAPLYGIKTGCNEAFIISDDTRRKLLAQTPNADEIIKPLVRGRDIRRWVVAWEQRWLIYVPWELKVEKYPAVAQHLERHRRALAGRAEVRAGRFPWYTLSRFGSEYAHLFPHPKIYYQVIQFAPGFALDSRGYVGNDKTYFIPTGDLFLLGVLNSPAMWWHNWRFLAHMKDDALNPAVAQVAQLPVPDAKHSVRRAVESVVSQLLEAQEQAENQWREFGKSLHRRWGDAGSGLVSAARKGGAALKSAFRKLVAQDEQPSKGEARELMAFADALVMTVGPTNAAHQSLERVLSERVFDAYGFTAEERALIWETAPPRTPLSSTDADEDLPMADD